MPENEIEVVEATSVNTVVDKGDNIVPYLFSLDKITKNNCKLCQADCREEAENLYEHQRKKNYTTITKWLNEQKNLEISRPAVRNHMVYHYRAVQRNNDLHLLRYLPITPL